MRTSQQGSISALVVCSVAGLLALAGLVYDGGRVIGEYVQLVDIAENAGRIGSQQMVGIREGNPRIDRVRANESINQYLDQYRINAVVDVADGGVRVMLRKRVHLTLLSLIGIGYRDIRITRLVDVVEG